jgi:hypothetical protein
MRAGYKLLVDAYILFGEYNYAIEALLRQRDLAEDFEDTKNLTEIYYDLAILFRE